MTRDEAKRLLNTISRTIVLGNAKFREALDVAISALQAQADGDTISRQAAITEFNCCELTPDGGIDVNYAIEFLEQLPPAEPEIIRCKDCKYWHREIYNGIEYFNFSSCDLNHHGDGHDFYCADAERRTDG